MIDGALGILVTEGLVSPFTELGPNDLTTLHPNDYVAAAHAHGQHLPRPGADHG